VAAAPFLLVKWYLDCVTDSGETAILYTADLRWHGIHGSFCSLLWTDGQAGRTESSMRPSHLVRNDDQILATLPGLSVAGEWSATAAPVQHTMYEAASGSVVWNCLQPGARVHLRIGDRNLSGLGYAECLTLTVPPWHLPMRQLRWGRFVSERDALAWIDWQGPYSISLAVHNGEKFEAPSILDSEVSFGPATLQMNEPLSLRSGRLGSTILPGAPALAKLLPNSLFNIEETKWRSRGILNTPDHQSRGWVIHEVVHWNL
jgi:hypothetical protein